MSTFKAGLLPASLARPVQPGESGRLTWLAALRADQGSALSGLTGTAGDTLAFMPPEQVLDFRKVKPAADQYAAAATLYNLLTDRPLYDNVGTPTDLFLRILQDSPVPLRSRRPEVPEPLAAAVQRALARKPEERYPGVGELRQALLPYTGNPPNGPGLVE